MQISIDYDDEDNEAGTVWAKTKLLCLWSCGCSCVALIVALTRGFKVVIPPEPVGLLGRYGARWRHVYVENDTFTSHNLHYFGVKPRVPADWFYVSCSYLLFVNRIACYIAQLFCNGGFACCFFQDSFLKYDMSTAQLDDVSSVAVPISSIKVIKRYLFTE